MHEGTLRFTKQEAEMLTNFYCSSWTYKLLSPIPLSKAIKPELGEPWALGVRWLHSQPEAEIQGEATAASPLAPSSTGRQLKGSPKPKVLRVRRAEPPTPPPACM